MVQKKKKLCEDTQSLWFANLRNSLIALNMIPVNSISNFIKSHSLVILSLI